MRIPEGDKREKGRRKEGGGKERERKKVFEVILTSIFHNKQQAPNHRSRKLTQHQP